MVIPVGYWLSYTTITVKRSLGKLNDLATIRLVKMKKFDNNTLLGVCRSYTQTLPWGLSMGVTCLEGNMIKSIEFFK